MNAFIPAPANTALRSTGVASSAATSARSAHPPIPAARSRLTSLTSAADDAEREHRVVVVARVE